MKLNNKGFAISSIMYIILVMAILIITVTLSVLSSRKLVLDKLRSEVSNKINQDIELSYKDTLKAIKVATQSYIDSGHNIDDAYIDSVSIESLKNDNYLSVSDKVLNYYNLSDKYVGFKNNNSTYSFMIGKEVNYNDLNGEILDIVDYHIEGESTQNTRSGKNLFNVNGTIEQFSPANYPTTVVNNQIHISPTEGNSQSSLFDYIKVSPNDKITVSFKLIQGRARISFRMYDSSKTIINDSSISISGFSYNQYYQGYYKDTNSATFTIPENVEYIRMQMIAMNNSDGIDNIYSEYQVEKGSSSTAYEEYGKSPSPEYPSEIKNVGDLITLDNCENYGSDACNNVGKYIIPIKVTGKNLFDISKVTTFKQNNYETELPTYGSISDNIITSNIGAYGQGAVLYDSKMVLKSGTYTIGASFMSDKESGNKGATLEIVDYTNNKEYVKHENLKNYKTWERVELSFTLDSETEIAVIVQGTGEKDDYMNLNMKIKDIQLEEGNKATKYEPYQEKTLYNIYLDEPLRKAGEYSDYIDFKKIVRKLNPIDLGTLTYTFGTTNSTYPYGYFETKISDVIYDSTQYVNSYYAGLCDCFTKTSSFKNDKSFIRNIKGETTYFIDSNYQDPTQFKSALNGCLFYYILKTFKEEDISLPNVVVKGGNKIEVDTSVKPSSVTYKVIEKMFDINV